MYADIQKDLVSGYNFMSHTAQNKLQSPNVATHDTTQTHNQSFITAGHHLWNNLPLLLHDTEATLLEFHQLPKTFVWLKIAVLSDF